MFSGVLLHALFSTQGLYRATCLPERYSLSENLWSSLGTCCAGPCQIGSTLVCCVHLVMHQLFAAHVRPSTPAYDIISVYAGAQLRLQEGEELHGRSTGPGYCPVHRGPSVTCCSGSSETHSARHWSLKVQSLRCAIPALCKPLPSPRLAPGRIRVGCRRKAWCPCRMYLVDKTGQYLLHFPVLEAGRIAQGPLTAVARCKEGTAAWSAFQTSCILSSRQLHDR